jgi:hypothetical protein
MLSLKYTNMEERGWNRYWCTWQLKSDNTFLVVVVVVVGCFFF